MNLLYANTSLFYKDEARVYKELSEILKCSIYGHALDSQMLLTSIGSVPSFKDIEYASIEDMMNFLKERIIVKYKPPYYLSWSGGVDSTAMVCAFLKENSEDTIVCYNDNSLKENNAFFKFLIRNKIQTSKIEDFSKTLEILDNNCYCLGQYMPGMSIDPDSELIIKNRLYNKRKDFNIKIKGLFDENIHSIINEYGFHIENIWDLYYYSQLRFKPHVEKYISYQFVNDLIKYNNYEFFFDIEYIFFFMLRNMNKFYSENYKLILKKYIVEHTKNKDYLDLAKINSRIFSRETRDRVLCIDSKGKMFCEDENSYKSYLLCSKTERFRKYLEIKEKMK